MKSNVHACIKLNNHIKGITVACKINAAVTCLFSTVLELLRQKTVPRVPPVTAESRCSFRDMSTHVCGVGQQTRASLNYTLFPSIGYRNDSDLEIN